MSTTGSVCIAEYVFRPYEQVCQLLEAWSGHPLSADGSTRPQYFLGDLLRVSRSVARLPVGRLGTVPTEQVAELRILPVNTGRDALTELLLVAPDSSSMPHVIHARGTQSLLAAILRQLDAAPRPESDAPRLAS